MEKLDLEEAQVDAGIESLKETSARHGKRRKAIEKNLNGLKEKEKHIEKDIEAETLAFEKIQGQESKVAIKVQRFQCAISAIDSEEARKLSKLISELLELGPPKHESRGDSTHFPARYDQCRDRIAAYEEEILLENQRIRSSEAKCKDLEAEICLLNRRISEVRLAARNEDQEALRLREIVIGCQAKLEISRHALDRSLPSSTGISALDDAIGHLKFLSESDQLGGQFYGRLSNFSFVPNPDNVVAVNAALADATNLRNCLTVSDRNTAHRVLQFFARNKIGMATCQILSELPEPPGRQAGSRTDGHGSDCGKCLKLPSLVATSNAGLEKVFHRLLGNWVLAEHRDRAVEMVREWSRAEGGRASFAPNIVTRQGELFKSDGEILGAVKSPVDSGKYCLRMSVCSLDSVSKWKPQQPQELKPKKIDASQQTQAQMEDARQQLTLLEKSMESRTQSLDSLEKQMRVLERDIQASKTSLMNGDRLKGLHRRVHLEKEYLECLLASADKAPKSLKIEAHIEREMETFRAAGRHVEGEREIDELHSKMHCQEQQYKALEEGLRQTRKQISACRGRLDAFAAESKVQDDLKSQKARLKKSRGVASNKLNETREARRAASAELAACTKVLSQLKEKERGILSNLQEMNSVMAVMELRICELEIKSKRVAEALLGLKEVIKQRSRDDSSSGNLSRTCEAAKGRTQCQTDTKEEGGSPRSGNECSPQHLRVGTRSRGNGLGIGVNIAGREEPNGAFKSDGCSSDFESDSDDERDLNAESIEREAASLAREERQLECLYRSIDLQAVDEDVEVLQTIKETEDKMLQLKEDIEKDTCERDTLESERYEKFLSAMRMVNTRFWPSHSNEVQFCLHMYLRCKTRPS
eukprot:evm.model.scf_410.8 EVM.evm.TU.scf_410.8   scf_410:56597-63632(-)